MKRRLLESLLSGISIWGYCLVWLVVLIMAAAMELYWRAGTEIRRHRGWEEKAGQSGETRT